jgi:hypothetical protein
MKALRHPRILLAAIPHAGIALAAIPAAAATGTAAATGMHPCRSAPL